MIYPEINELSDRMNIGGEVWRDVFGWEGIYEISSRGRVKRIKRRVTHKNQVTDFSMVYPAKILKAHPDSRGYPQVSLNGISEGKSKRVARVHRLVAEAFIPNPHNKAQVNHINSNTMDAHLSNLEWCTASENQKHSWGLGGRERKFGEDSPVCRYTEDVIAKVYRLAKMKAMSQEKIGKKYSMPQITVSNIRTKKTWRHITDLIDKEIH